MEPSAYLEQIHDSGDGTAFVVLEVGPGRELRARLTDGGIRIETWTRGEITELSAETLSRLHALTELRAGIRR